MPVMRTVQILYAAIAAGVLVMAALAVLGAQWLYAETVPQAWLGAVLVVGVLAELAALSWVGSRPLRGATAAELRSAYLHRSLVVAVLSDLPAVAGFVVVVVGGPHWTIWFGIGVSISELATTFPTPARLARHDARLRLAGAPLTLTEALLAAPQPGLPGEPPG